MKIFECLILFLWCGFLSPVSVAQSYIDEKGDVNSDGQINVLDVLGVVNHILGIVVLDEQGSWRADCNGSEGSCDGDGVINIIDALKIVNIILGSDGCSGTTVTDIDGNVYHTIAIGTQVWMVENLKTTKYRNGDPIPNVTDDAAWFNLATGAYCNYDNDPNNAATYGRLYNWYAVDDSRNIAPAGWHVPSDAEWMTLINYLSGLDLAGGKLKESGTSHWSSPNAGATNESGFTGLPGGYRNGDGPFNHLGNNAFWWTATLDNASKSWRLTIHYFDSTVDRNSYYMMGGMSVRCIQD